MLVSLMRGSEAWIVGAMNTVLRLSNAAQTARSSAIQSGFAFLFAEDSSDSSDRVSTKSAFMLYLRGNQVGLSNGKRPNRKVLLC